MSGTFQWSVAIEFIGQPSMGTRELNNVIKTAFHEVGVHWHQKFLPRHFTNAAFGLYGYQPRSKKYWFRKLKRTGQALPLVMTGESRAIATNNATITSTHKEVRVAMPAYKLNYKPRTSGRPPIDMRKELTTINPDEHRQLESVMARSLRKELRSQRNRVRVKIGG